MAFSPSRKSVICCLFCTLLTNINFMLKGCAKDDTSALEVGDEGFDQFVKDNPQHERALLVATGRMAPYPPKGMDNADNATLESSSSSICFLKLFGGSCEKKCTQEVARCCGACGKDGAFAKQQNQCGYTCDWSDPWGMVQACSACGWAKCWMDDLCHSTENGCNSVLGEMQCLAGGSGDASSSMCKVLGIASCFR